MKKVILLSMLFFATMLISSCGGDKKVKHAAETVKTATKKVVEKTEDAAKSVAGSISSQAKTGLKLMEAFDAANKCSVCHKGDTKVIGPSWKEIAKVYKEKNGDIVKFLKGNSEAIVDPAQFAIMKTNLDKTKLLSDTELEAIVAYIKTF